MSTLRHVATASVVLSLVILGSQSHAQEQAFGWERFERYLESLRLQANIPGLSAAIVKDGQVAWEHGLGFQNVDALIRAQPDTPYHVVGLTQTMSAALAMQCVEQRRLNLRSLVISFVQGFPEPTATLRHLMTHTSEGVPGTAFRFNLARYALLTPAIERCWPRTTVAPGTSTARRPVRDIIMEGILDRLAMTDSVPGQDVTSPEMAATLNPRLYDRARLDRYRSVLARLAQPYVSGSASHPTPAVYPANTLDAASGLITTVRDIARFDIALGDLILVRADTIEQMWTPPVPLIPIGTLPPQAAAVPLPHALGWFVQDYQGTRLVWQFGRWPEVTSSIVVKVPSRNLTFILLANSDGLAKTAALETGDITTSLFVQLFLRFFL